MAKDFYSEEIGSSVSTKDYFSQELGTEKTTQPTLRLKDIQKVPFWEAIGGEAGKKEIPTELYQHGIDIEKTNPLWSLLYKGGGTATQTARDIFATPAAFFNQALLNAPRSLLAKAGTEYPTGGETAGGKAGYYAGGVAGAIESPIYKALNRFGMGTPKTGLGMKTLRSAVVGGIGGAAYSPEDFTDIKTRAFQGGIGAVAGGTIPLVSAGISKGIGKLKELRELSKGLKQIRVDIGEEKLPVSELPRKIGEIGTDVQDTLTQHNEDFSKIIDTEAQSGARGIKQKLIDFGKNLSENYEKGLDTIQNKLRASRGGEAINPYDMADFYQRAINKVSEDPVAYQRIINSAEKEGFNVVAGMSDDGLKQFTVTAGQDFFKTNPFKTYTLNDFLDVKNSFKSQGAITQGRSGNVISRVDDAYKAVRDTLGEVLSERFPGEVGQDFTKLQSDYAPLAQAKWKAYKIFQPYDPAGINLERGTKFFTDYAMEKAKAGQQELLDILEKGSKFSPGMGDVTSRIRALGKQGLNTEKDLNNFISDIVKQQSVARDMLSQQKALIDQRNKVLLGIGILTGTGGGIAKATHLF